MKKTILLVLALVLSLSAVCTLAACGSKKDASTGTVGDTTVAETTRVEEWIFTADNLTDAAEIYDSFFYLTIYEDNMIVTVSNDEGVFLTETIDGEIDHVEYSWDEEYFAYRDGDDYLFAARDGNNKYYLIDEEAYSDNILAFTFYLDVLSDLPSEGVTVNLTSQGTSTYVGYDILLDATLTLEVGYEDTTTTVTAQKVSDKVVSFRSVYTDPDGSYTVDVNFAFGTASVTAPDLSDWFNASAPRVESEWYVTGKVGGQNVDEIPMYYEYQSGCYRTDYVDVVLGDAFTVRNKNDDSVSYPAKIDSEILTGYEMIVFDPDDESICFEIEGDPADPS